MRQCHFTGLEMSCRQPNPDFYTMDQNKLQQLINDLRQELHAADSADEASKELLRRTAAEIDEAVGTGQVSDDRHRSIREQLEQSAVDFEADHPRIAAVVESIIDTLGKIGI